MKNHKQFTLPIIASQTQPITGVSKMFKDIAKFSAVLVFIGLLTACAGNSLLHNYIMRGQVVGVEENDVILCIGSHDGAQVGQVLEVYRVVNENRFYEKGDLFKKNYIGEVVIGSIVDDHFARASVNSGDVKMHDIVELEK